MGREEAGERRLDVAVLGRVPYGEALELQEKLVARRRSGEVGDRLLLLEHPHVITMGSAAREEHLLLGRPELAARGISLFASGRGGDVTYHGPGQLVGYPVLRLEEERRDLHRYLRDLEEVLIRGVASLGVEGGRAEGLTGVWAEGAKLAAIGVRVSSGWITSHGFALNVAPDLRYFDAILPCGLPGARVTSLSELLSRDVSFAEVIPKVAGAFEEVFGREVRVIEEPAGDAEGSAPVRASGH